MPGRRKHTDLDPYAQRYRPATEEETQEWLAGHLDIPDARETPHGLEVPEQFQDPGGFHRWSSTDEPRQDVCERCGTIAPDFGEGVLSDHSPLPIYCPGVSIYGHAHHFVSSVDGTIECAHCGTTIGPDTETGTINWACARD